MRGLKSARGHESCSRAFRGQTTLTSRLSGVTEALENGSVALDAEFPLDDGENAALTPANRLDVPRFLCDEFSQLGLIHAEVLAELRVRSAHRIPGVGTPSGKTVFHTADTDRAI